MPGPVLGGRDQRCIKSSSESSNNNDVEESSKSRDREESGQFCSGRSRTFPRKYKSGLSFEGQIGILWLDGPEWKN